jgi:hypothetical protein
MLYSFRWPTTTNSSCDLSGIALVLFAAQRQSRMITRFRRTKFYHSEFRGLRAWDYVDVQTYYQIRAFKSQVGMKVGRENNPKSLNN